MKLVVGLGNPGAGYRRNRHNVGFMAVDAIASRHDVGPFRQRHAGEFAVGRIGDMQVALLKPLTYMNESGRSAAAALRWHKLPLGDLLVIHDEIALAPGRVRAKIGGGAAGHNGVRSGAGHVGAGFQRVRNGVGHPGERDRVVGHVLGDFRASDSDWLDPLLERLADAFPLLLAGDDSRFLSSTQLPRRAADPTPAGTSARDAK